MARLTVAERILVHLYQYHRLRGEYASPEEVSQQGISAAVGISRAHAALELKKLRERGLVEERTSHVRGASSRRLVYFLTRGGEERARAIREASLGLPARWVDLEGRAHEGTAREMLEALRGIPGRDLRVLEAVHVGALLDARTLVPGGEPVAPPLVGRRAELERLGQWLADPAVRLVVVTGIAGIGKTTVARAAARLQGRPVLWLHLFPGDSPRSLLPNLAASLEALRRPALRGALRNGLAYGPEALALLGREVEGLLVVLDDLAPTRENSSLLGALLEAPGDVKLLATSRERLALHPWPHLAGAVEELRLEGLDEAAAMELLRAKGLAPDEGEFRAIYRATRGHPLGLQILGSPTRARRHASLEDLLAGEVLAGLTAEQQAVLQLLSIQRLPVGADALASLSPVELRTLLRRSLVLEEGGGYAVHGLVAEFFAARLGGEARRRLHGTAGDYWVDRGRPDEAIPHLVRGGREAEAARLLAAAHGALDTWGVREDDWPLYRALAPPPGARAEFLLARAQLADRLGRWAEAAEDLRAMPPSPLLPEARVLEGHLASKAGDLGAARRAFREAVRLAQGDGGRAPVAKALVGLAIVESKGGRRRRARKLLEEAMAAATAAGEALVRGRIAMELGVLELDAGNYAGALGPLTAAVELLQGSPFELAKVYNNLGFAYTRLGRHADAEGALAKSLAYAEGTGQLRIQGYALLSAAELHLRGGDLARAMGLCRATFELLKRIDDRALRSWAHATLGQVREREGRLDEAERELLRALEVAREAAHRPTEAERRRDLEAFYRRRGGEGSGAPERAAP